MATTQVLVRIDPKIRRALEKIKKTTGKSIAFQANKAFEWWIEQESAQKPAE